MLPDSISFLFSQLQKYDPTLRIPSKGFNYSIADSLLTNSYTKYAEVMTSDDLQRFVTLYRNSFNSTPEEKGHGEEWSGNVDFVKSHFVEAEENYQTAIELYTIANDSSSLGRVYNLYGNILFYKGDIDAATKNHKRALSLFESLKDTAGMVSSIKLLGTAFQQIEKYKEAESLFRIGLNYYSRMKDSAGIGELKSLLGNLFHQTGNQKLSRRYAEDALRIYKMIGDQVGIAYGYNNFAVGEMSDGNFEGAKPWILKSIALSDSIKDFAQLPAELFNLGVCELETGNIEQARAILIRSVEASNKNKEVTEEKLRAQKMLSDIYQKLGMPEQALQEYKRYSLLRDSLYNSENTRMLEELKVSYQTQKHQENLAQSEQDRIGNKRWIVLLSISISLLILLVIFFVWFTLFNARNKQELIKLEQELIQKEIEQIRTELDFNQDQLAEYILQMKEKSQQIIQLEEELLKGKSQAGDEITSTADLQNNESAEPESIFGFRILTEEDWSRFKKYFDKVFPGKILQLREIYPEITSAEQRIFMLIRLKTESREIAGMLAISPESVRKTKYRLKKKLRLNEEDSLDEFIKKF
jgi:tetratricopeptide (TPR) repeat protein